VLFNSNGSKLAGTRIGTSLIDSFTVGSTGLLTPAPRSPLPAQAVGPFGSEFRPTNPGQLFVSNAHNGPGAGTVSAFRDAANGTLTAIAGSPFAGFQTVPCWVEITNDGQFLFTVNTASVSISRYAIAASGALTLLGSTPVKGTSAGAVDARLSPNGSNLYVDEASTGAVAAFTVQGGSLTELASSPFLAACWRCADRHRRHLAATTTRSRGRRSAPGSARHNPAAQLGGSVYSRRRREDCGASSLPRAAPWPQPCSGTPQQAGRTSARDTQDPTLCLRHVIGPSLDRCTHCRRSALVAVQDGACRVVCIAV